MCDIDLCKKTCEEIKSSNSSIDIWELCKTCPILDPIYKCTYKQIPKPKCKESCKTTKCSDFDTIKEVLYECGSCVDNSSSIDNVGGKTTMCHQESDDFKCYEKEYKKRINKVNENNTKLYGKCAINQSSLSEFGGGNDYGGGGSGGGTDDGIGGGSGDGMGGSESGGIGNMNESSSDGGSGTGAGTGPSGDYAGPSGDDGRYGG